MRSVFVVVYIFSAPVDAVTDQSTRLVACFFSSIGLELFDLARVCMRSFLC